MKKSIFVLTLFGWLILAGPFPLCAQEDMTEVSRDPFPSPQREAAVFHHDAHNEKAELDECGLCHHSYEDGKLLEDEVSVDQSCSECHAVQSAKENPLPLRKAFHSRCRGCHEEQKKGPVMCGECHVKGIEG